LQSKSSAGSGKRNNRLASGSDASGTESAEMLVKRRGTFARIGGIRRWGGAGRGGGQGEGRTVTKAREGGKFLKDRGLTIYHALT